MNPADESYYPTGRITPSGGQPGESRKAGRQEERGVRCGARWHIWKEQWGE